MATAKAWGSLTIVDLSDIGEFSVAPMSSLPLSVIYDPNQNAYNPDWGTNNLVLTPVIYYAGKQLTLGTSGLTVTWQRQEGVGTVSSLTANETVSANGILTVNANKFTTSIAMISYIVNATYVEASSGITLNAQGQITFSLIKMASNVKTCTITGDNIFKYNTDNTLVSANPVVLTGSVSNVSISRWQYKNASGNFVNFPVTSGNNTSNQNTTLNVYDTENVFVNDKAIIRLTTSDSNVYDMITVVKLRDGAAGSNNVSVVLTNESQMIPADSNGNIPQGGLSTAYTTVKVYEGGEEQTGWTITPTPSNVTGTWDATTQTYTVTGITGDVGYVDFTCTHKDYNGTIIKRFSLTKIKTGANGVSPTVYMLDLSTVAVNKTKDGAMNPSTVTLRAYQHNGTTKSAYSGRFKVYVDDNTTTTYSSTSNESSHTLTMSDYSSASKLKVELYNDGGSTLYDTETIVIVNDGQKGEDGQPGVKGDAAVNVVLGNYADTIGVDNNHKLTSALTITIPFTAYEGTTRIPCTCTAGALQGVSATVTNATASRDGSIVYSLANAKNMGTSLNGTITLSFTATASSGTVTKTEYYSYTLSPMAENGQNATLLQLHTPSGYEFNNGTGTLTIKAFLTDGATEVTNSASYKWERFTSSGYVEINSSNANGITNYTSSELSVPASAVETYASYKCTATYNGKPSVAYSFLRDRTDPIQVTMISTIGEQIKNGNGVGVVYPRVIRNGVEVDPLPNGISFVTAKPNPLVNGAYYYLLSQTDKSATLYKATSTSAWTTTTGYTYTGSYKWTYRNKNNELTTTNTPATTGRVIYIDATLINEKIVIDVEVDI